MGPASASTNKDLLNLEKKNPNFSSSSSLELSLLFCKNEASSQTSRPRTCSEKLVTSSVPKSQVMGKVKDFLGVMAEANERLKHDAKEKSSIEYDIEALTGNETEYIEMDLVLGIADLHTPEAIVAAESAMAGSGSHSVIPLSTANCSGSDSESSEEDDDDDSSDNDDDNDKGGSLDELKKSKSEKEAIVSNYQLKKRQKIVELL